LGGDPIRAFHLIVFHAIRDADVVFQRKRGYVDLGAVDAYSDFDAVGNRRRGLDRGHFEFEPRLVALREGGARGKGYGDEFRCGHVLSYGSWTKKIHEY